MEIHKTIYKTKNKEIKILRVSRIRSLKGSFGIYRQATNSHEKYIRVRVGLFGFEIYSTDLKEKEKWDELDAKTHDSWLY